ncbi:hypothetical protein [Ensifer sp. 4252]|uniref:hypothetical protein n=1 Tax=Ensifer sp. 4252 TaxID=3373915 RepID=UPI003D25DF4A
MSGHERACRSVLERMRLTFAPIFSAIRAKIPTANRDEEKNSKKFCFSGLLWPQARTPSRRENLFPNTLNKPFIPCSK